MTLRDWMASQRPQYLVLWGLAVVFVVIALADLSLLGMDPVMLAILAAVFAALTTVYQKGSN